MNISKSGFYDWRGRPKSSLQQENEQLLGKLKQCFKDSRHTYGVRRLTEDLNGLGEPVNHKRVADNVLNRRFDLNKPNAVWVSDITYIATKAGWVYLAVIIDLYSRQVI